MHNVEMSVLSKGNVRIRKKKKNGLDYDDSQEQKLGKLIDYLQSIKTEDMTGYIKVNFNQGNICKVERYEEILKKCKK